MLATTGARLNPISMTTAPVTTGGSTLWMTPEPSEVDEHTDEREHDAGDQDRAGHLRRSPPWARIAATPPTNEALVPR